ncbi:hypothetical protein [Candidatus Pelagibacter communis]|uniref:hypothetical protein n=1 Tax=Pelagibacter ubique TaxID=198252 RepID=UPI00094D10D2|nr:hypothetical protein [Candidatus Pelagibacter ubique]
MLKKLSQILVIIIFLIISFCIYLSIYGINTDKLNGIINEKISERDGDFDIKLNKIKIFLDIGSLKLEAKTKNPIIFYKKNKIELQSISTALPLLSIFTQEAKIENLKFITKKNKVKDLIEFGRGFQNTPQLLILKKMVKSGDISIEAKINFSEDGSILKDYVIDGDLENVNLRLLSKDIIENIKFGFILKNNDYVIYNASSFYQDIKFKSDEIRIKEKNNAFLFNGNISTSKDDLSLKMISKIFQLDLESIKNDKIVFSSNNKFSFELSKKFKFSNMKANSKFNIESLEYPNSSLKEFFPGYKDGVKFENNVVNLDYQNGNYKISGDSKLNINEDVDSLSYLIEKKKDKISFKTDFEVKSNALNLELLNYTKKKDVKSNLILEGVVNKDSSVFLNKINFAESKNLIKIKNINLNSKKKFKRIDQIEIDLVNNNDQISQLNIKRKKSNYSINSKIFDGTKILDRILFSKSDGNFFDVFEKLNSKISINFDTIYITNEDYLTNFKADMIVNNNQIKDLILSSQFATKEDLKLSIKTNSNNEKITDLFAGNAKPLVKKYDFIKGFEGGYLKFDSIEKNKVSNSNLRIFDFKLKEVPALTKLLTLASLQGIADLLTGEGIRFNEFEMIFNNKAGLMTIEEIYSLGPSISILMDGYIQKDDLVSLRGTLVPATTVNKVIGSIPLIGDILVGKKAGEGVFGVSFKIKGYPDDLKTTVNPIKTLTPRFITRTLEKIKKSSQ